MVAFNSFPKWQAIVIHGEKPSKVHMSLHPKNGVPFKISLGAYSLARRRKYLWRAGLASLAKCCLFSLMCYKLQIEKGHLIFASVDGTFFWAKWFFSLNNNNLPIFMLSGNMPFVPFTAASILNSYCTVINSVFKELAEGLNVCSGKCFCYVTVFHFLFESSSDVFICIFSSS